MTEQNISTTEKEELIHLELIKNKLNIAISNIENLVGNQYEEIMDQKKYLSDSKAEMDHVEKVSVRQSIDQMASIAEHSLAKKKRLLKVVQSPYFGRIDFSQNGEGNIKSIYIGIHNFADPKTDENIIYDWRAPISSMFYDFELGEAYYIAPEGKTNGKIFLKRQFRIENGKMKFMLESSMNIIDDVLQKELSKSSDEKMKNIVATIQRDQNAIIRNEKSTELIIQGAAGSGKTSIALHRIAFLLYKFKETISSKDILIISPNKVFGDYISNVLPELGEETILETSMENLASEIFRHQLKFQTFFEQVAYLLEKNDKNFIERIRFKASVEFLRKIDQYIRTLKSKNFDAVDIKHSRYLVPADFIEERFNKFNRISIDKKITHVVNNIVDFVKFKFNYEIQGNERNEIRKSLRKMFRSTNIKVLYKEFYNWLGKPDMFKMAKGSTYEYADVFPLTYLKIRLEGAAKFDKVKHLVIDEMQDYTPVQYKVIAALFNCKKTILGDSNQSVNPFSSSTADSIAEVFPKSDRVYMNKSYRSTIEITEFAQQIQRNEKLEPIERHGEIPIIKLCISDEEEITEIRNEIKDFNSKEYKTFGIICKTQIQADLIYDKVKNINLSVNLLNSESYSFTNGIIITTAHMSKGLEFDQVLVPFGSKQNYKTEIDKHMLYVACTRAMHKLTVTFTGSNSKFLDNLVKQSVK